MSGKDLILILGSGRSGTSAVTRLLSLCGCSLPQSVVGATRLNPTGHWEPVDATNLNVEFVTRHGLVSDPSMRLDEGDIDECVRNEFIEDIQSFLLTCPESPALVVKEFRINELFEFWVEAARRNGLSVKALIAVRHPQEVFASTHAAFSPSEQVTSAAAESRSMEWFNTFWLKMNLLAERHSRGLPRVFVEYSNLMTDWRVEIGRISKALSIDLKIDEAAIDGFLNPALHRHRYAGPVAETFAYSWMTRVYSILSAASQDGRMDLPSLDEIYHAYRTNARAFRVSTAEVQKASNKYTRDFVERLPVWKSGRDF